MPNPMTLPPFGNPNSPDPLVRHPRHALAFLRYLAGDRQTPPPSAADTPAPEAREVEAAVRDLVHRAARGTA